MTYDEYNDYCQSLPATSYIMQWGNSHVWKVGGTNTGKGSAGGKDKGKDKGKVFAIGGWEKTDQPAFTFKTSKLNFDVLQDQAGFRPAPYMASRGMMWIQQFDPNEISDDELKYYIKESHRIVSLGLTKKLQKELGLNQE